MNSKGFTLIELLVVIAIIGILASVVLVSFPGAQKKAKDARVVSAISQMRTVWTYMYANQGDWTDVGCPGEGTDMEELCTEVRNNNYDGSEAVVITGTAEDEICIWTTLNEKDGASAYCASGDGRAGYVNPDERADMSSTTCSTAATYACPPLRGE